MHLSRTCRVWKCLTLASRWAPVSQKCRVRKFHEWAPHWAPLSQMCRIQMHLKWAPISYYCHETPFENSHTRQTCCKIAAVEYFCQLKHEILFSGRAASEHVRKSLLLYIQLVWFFLIGTKLDLTYWCQKMSCKAGLPLPTISSYNSMSALSSITTEHQR